MSGHHSTVRRTKAGEADVNRGLMSSGPARTRTRDLLLRMAASYPLDSTGRWKIHCSRVLALKKVNLVCALVGDQYFAPPLGQVGFANLRFMLVRPQDELPQHALLLMLFSIIPSSRHNLRSHCAIPLSTMLFMDSSLFINNKCGSPMSLMSTGLCRTVA